MYGPAELDFTLDIDHLAAARAHLAGDAGRPPKGEAAELGDTEAIDLADLRASRVDQRHFFEDGFLRAIAQPRRTPNARRQRAVHVGARDHAALCVARAKIGFDQDLAQLLDYQRQFAGMLGQTCGMLQHQGDRVAIESIQGIAPCKARHQAGEDSLVLRRPRQGHFRNRQAL